MVAEAKRPANMPEQYAVPADFDASAALVECDFSDAAAARRTLPWAYLQRWLALRDEVNADLAESTSMETSHRL